ncbi:hypothetical protein FQA39_LY08244 [Lamprigera yunnana]|nr:hypothetical protein FQA39_LY08244 [Lamprigera yunnana]
MKIVVIGAGPAGLASLKYSLDDGHDCVVYEQTGSLGGTWVYTDKTDIDENGLPVHSAMYEGLRTNLPKEVMYFLDYPYPPDKIKSYITQKEVLEYFTNYAKEFNLEKFIKYYKRVTSVTPIDNDKWHLQIQDVITKEEIFEIYDAVFVCNGHYSNPFIPKIPGQDIFTGVQFHSHQYRRPELYENKNVLLIGAGSSGLDIAVKIAEHSKKAFLSHRNKDIIQDMQGVEEKVEVVQFTNNTAVFADGSSEDVDVIIYCTGYLYSFPFLADACDIEVEKNWVLPLYKHVINIKHPTMFFIGIPLVVPVIPVCYVQVQFSLASLKKHFLPSQEDMLQELESRKVYMKFHKIPNKYAHKISSDNLEDYFQELSQTADIEPVPKAFHPSGIRVTLPDIKGVSEFFLWGNINIPMEGKDLGEIMLSTYKATDGVWVLEDMDVKLKPGDTIYYTYFININGVIYRYEREKFTIEEILEIPSTTTTKPTTTKSTTTNPTITKPTTTKPTTTKPTTTSPTTAKPKDPTTESKDLCFDDVLYINLNKDGTMVAIEGKSGEVKKIQTNDCNKMLVVDIENGNVSIEEAPDSFKEI